MAVIIKQDIDEIEFFWYSMRMVKSRTPNLRTNEIKKLAHTLVSKASDKWGQKPISKQEFKKLVERAPGEHFSQIRSGRKFFSPHETKNFFKEFVKHIQEHPEYKLSTAARKVFNVRLHQGDNAIENFDPEKIGKKGLAFVAQAQKEADAKLNTGPTEEEKLKQLRRERAMKFLNVYRSKQQRDAMASGKGSGPPSSISQAQTKQATGSVVSHEGAGTIAGASQVAGQSGQASASIANQPKADQAGQQDSASPTPLAAGLRQAGKPDSTEPTKIKIPKIGPADEPAKDQPTDAQSQESNQDLAGRYAAEKSAAPKPETEEAESEKEPKIKASEVDKDLPL